MSTGAQAIITLDEVNRLAPTTIARLTTDLIGWLKLVTGTDLGHVITDVRALNQESRAFLQALNTQAALASEKVKC